MTQNRRPITTWFRAVARVLLPWRDRDGAGSIAPTPAPPVGGPVAAVDEVYLVNVDSGDNHNKFYRATLRDDGSIQTNWGRVGAAGQSQLKQGGRGAYDALIRAKELKGYSRVDVLAAVSTSRGTVRSAELRDAAHSSLTGGSTDPVLVSLVDRLVRANKHQLLAASGGLIDIDLSGQVTTALGVVSGASVREARRLMDEMSTLPAGSARARLTEDYLRIVPQKVNISAGRGWAETWLTSLTTPQKQYALLDGLEASVSFAATARDNAAPGAHGRREDLFRYRVRALDENDADFTMVADRYAQTTQEVHAWAKDLTVARVFALTDARHADSIRETAARVRNVRRLWHGTGVANVLSILQKGLFVPPTVGTDIHIAGRMFGDGIYLSRSASKSLAYSVGYWGGGSSGTESAFMFLTRTAMGSEYRPRAAAYDPAIPAKARTERNKFGNHYDSINVEAGRGGVRNHEAIVWDTLQVDLSYLVELA